MSSFTEGVRPLAMRPTPEIVSRARTLLAAGLTAFEWRALALYATGKGRREMALALYGDDTYCLRLWVDRCIERIMGKVGVTSEQELITFYALSAASIEGAITR